MVLDGLEPKCVESPSEKQRLGKFMLGLDLGWGAKTLKFLWKNKVLEGLEQKTSKFLAKNKVWEGIESTNIEIR